MKRLVCFILAVIIFPFFLENSAYSHCQIPCGIYDDEMRFKMTSEDIDTVEKSMKTINDLSMAKNKDMNQIVRWVNNKDLHADKISDTATYYFLAQRVKIPSPSDKAARKKYLKELELLHKLVFYSMKAKQSTDQVYVDEMRKALDEFKKEYYTQVSEKKGS